MTDPERYPGLRTNIVAVVVAVVIVATLWGLGDFDGAGAVTAIVGIVAFFVVYIILARRRTQTPDK